MPPALLTSSCSPTACNHGHNPLSGTSSISSMADTCSSAAVESSAAACQPAGTLGTSPPFAMARQLYHQHRTWERLLAGRSCKPLRAGSPSRRIGREYGCDGSPQCPALLWSSIRDGALDTTTDAWAMTNPVGTERRSAMEQLGYGWSLCLWNPLGSLLHTRITEYLQYSLSADEGAADFLLGSSSQIHIQNEADYCSCTSPEQITLPIRATVAAVSMAEPPTSPSSANSPEYHHEQSPGHRQRLPAAVAISPQSPGAACHISRRGRSDGIWATD